MKVIMMMCYPFGSLKNKHPWLKIILVYYYNSVYLK